MSRATVLPAAAARVRLLIFLPLCFCVFSCSLSYLEEEQQRDDIPEFVFSAPVLCRVEDGRLSLSVTASVLEQYKAENSFYGTDIGFEIFSPEGETDVSGSAGALYGSRTDDIYMLFGSALLSDYARGTQISSGRLKWNGKTEQLVSGSDGLVRITQDTKPGEQADAGNSGGSTAVTGSGYGFSADAETWEYRFGRDVSGTITVTQEERQ